MTYNETLKSLFAILEQSNLADSDNAKPWQRSIDANQRSGMYGHVRKAIVAIAGEAIVERWAETGDINYGIANR